MKPIKTSLPVIGFWDTRQGGRAENQDSCGFIDTPLGLIAVVCDGMGGGPAGQLASDTAVQKIVECVMKAPQEESRIEVMKKAVEYAHHSILGITKENPRLKGMGTTVASVLINSDSAIIAHVGDSRVYQLRRGHKIFRTADHSYVAELVKSGEISEERARVHPQSNLLLKALGGNAEDLAEVEERPYEAGDRFMICTDGIWGMLPEKELIRRTAKTPSLAGAVDGTVLEVDELGRKNGNTHDNLTIILLETKQDSKLKEKMSKKTLKILAALAAICLISIIVNIALVSKLLTPSDQIEQLKQEIANRDTTIVNLQQEISQLRKDVTASMKETLDAERRVNEEKTKTAEAKQAQSEAEKQNQELKDAVDQAKKAADELNSRIEGVINVLNQAKNEKDSNKRTNFHKSITAELETLSKKDAKNKDTYIKVKNEIVKNKGIKYAELIEKLKKLINKK